MRLAVQDVALQAEERQGRRMQQEEKRGWRSSMGAGCIRMGRQVQHEYHVVGDDGQSRRQRSLGRRLGEQGCTGEVEAVRVKRSEA